MRNPIELSLALILISATAGAEVSYPRGTTLEEAWTSPPKISSQAAVEILAARLLDRRQPGEEKSLDSDHLEAFKYLVGEHLQASEEPPVQTGMRRFGGEISAENMTAGQSEFFGLLSAALADRLGLTAMAPPDACVAEKRLWEATKYKYDIGWNEVEIWGLTAFGYNLQYGLNHSDLAYGLFPWGIRMSWLGAIGCGIGRPDNEDELRACGSTKEWKLHGSSSMRHSSAYEHVVPGVAQASLPFAGALLSGSADQFRTSDQTRSGTNPTWLLGPSNVPLPSESFPSDTCVGACDTGIALDFLYRFSRVVAWYPDIVLNASYNHLVPAKHERFQYSGQSDGNPHALGSWTLRRDFSRFHAPFPSCS